MEEFLRLNINDFLAQEDPERFVKFMQETVRIPAYKGGKTDLTWIVSNELAQRCVDGTHSRVDYYPSSNDTIMGRCMFDEFGVALKFEQILRDNFWADFSTTLVLDCTLDGIYTMSTRLLALKKYKVAVASPRNNLENVLAAVKMLGPLYQQTVLVGSPSFLETVLDAGITQNLDWKEFTIGMILTEGVISEETRVSMASRACILEPGSRVISTHQTLSAHDTILSCNIRKYLSLNPQVSRELFASDELPALMQYDPLTRTFEVEEGQLLLTTLPFVTSQGSLMDQCAAPLIRFETGHVGGIVSFDDLIAFLKTKGYHPMDTNAAKAPRGRGYRRLPFVWVHSL